MSEPLIPYDLGVREPPGGLRNVFPRNRPDTRVTGIMPFPEVHGTFEGVMYPEQAAYFRDFFERVDRSEWIEAVKRRLGIIEHGDSVTVRLAQWERDRWHSGGIPWPEPASGYVSSGYLWGRKEPQ